MKAPHNVTIKDIAQQLKISASTVSRALRGSKEIKKETRIMVKELATRLNYSPNPIALSLKDKRSKIIGVIVPEIANTFCSATIAGIEDIAYNKGYHVVIFQSHEKYEREVINTRLLSLRRIDGLIISLSNETNRYDHLRKVIDNNIPVVMFDRIYDGIDTHKVVVDDYTGAFRATEHLIEQGYKKIAHITISEFLSITKNRLQGYKDALKKHGLTFREDRVLHCNFDTKEMGKAIRSLFQNTDRPNAILASVERIAIGCISELREMNLRIPEDVALIGFSDNPLNKLLTPALSSVQQPTFEMGQKSAELLIDLIEKNKNPRKFKTISLNTIVDIQASSMRVNHDPRVRKKSTEYEVGSTK